MQTDWLLGLLGGGIIGLAGAMYLLINGRIMGASGIIGGLVDGSGRSTAGERLAFIAGLVAVPGIAALAMGGSETNLTGNLAVVVIAGVVFVSGLLRGEHPRGENPEPAGRRHRGHHLRSADPAHPRKDYGVLD